VIADIVLTVVVGKVRRFDELGASMSVARKVAIVDRLHLMETAGCP
jgi:hypothetical protein